MGGGGCVNQLNQPCQPSSTNQPSSQPFTFISDFLFPSTRWLSPQACQTRNFLPPSMPSSRVSSFLPCPPPLRFCSPSLPPRAATGVSPLRALRREHLTSRSRRRVTTVCPRTPPARNDPGWKKQRSAPLQPGSPTTPPNQDLQYLRTVVDNNDRQPFKLYETKKFTQESSIQEHPFYSSAPMSSRRQPTPPPQE